MTFALRMTTRTILRAPISTRAFTVASFARAAYSDIRGLPNVFQATNGLTNADIVTDLYLKSLREFKPTAAKASDSEGQVKSWSAPAPPQAPESASNVESELSAYESSEVESASSGSSATASTENDGDWFELDTSPDHAHH